MLSIPYHKNYYICAQTRHQAQFYKWLTSISMKKLSILIPVFNESKTIYEVLEKVNGVFLTQDIEKEIIVVNDCSTDTSLREIERYIQNFPNQGIFLVSHQINQGKGATLRTGIGYATGDYTIIQDADLELDPNDYNIILMPVLEKTADIVYGSRFLKKKKEGAFFSILANGFLTQLSNFVFRINITDMETCYKLIPTPIFQALILVENRFGFEPEITAKLAKIKHLKWAEVPITYNPRTNMQGKKIGWKDGIRAMFCIIRYGWFWKAEKSFKNSSAFTDSDKH
jgi:glycosyltransferase involved in cell wall biosynthesis